MKTSDRAPCVRCGGLVPEDRSSRAIHCSRACTKAHARHLECLRSGRRPGKLTLLTIDGVTRRLSEWCRIYDMKKVTVAGRIKRGWTPREALEQKPLSRSEGARRRASRNPFFTMDGVRRPLSEWCRIRGVRRATVARRLREGWTVREALRPPMTHQERGSVRKVWRW